MELGRGCVHKRIKSPYNYTTVKEHLASTHQFVTDWRPQRFIDWGASIDDNVKEFIIKLLEKKQHPEQAYKSCVGVLSFSKKVGKERLINACKRALNHEVYNYRIIQNILERGLDKLSEEPVEQQAELPIHQNIRGNKYYK